jgi:hypothetical protein
LHVLHSIDEAVQISKPKNWLIRNNFWGRRTIGSKLIAEATHFDCKCICKRNKCSSKCICKRNKWKMKDQKKKIQTHQYKHASKWRAVGDIIRGPTP